MCVCVCVCVCLCVGVSAAEREARDHKFPELSQPFSGRDELVEQAITTLNNMLQSEETEKRVLALRGSNGMGKSSIAIAVARKLAEIEDNYVHFVPLRGCITCPVAVRRIVHIISPNSTGNSMKTLEEEISVLEGNPVLILDDLEDCVYSVSNNTAQLSDSDYSVAEMLERILDYHNTVRIILTCCQTMEGDLVEMEVPALEPAISYKLMRTLAPCLSKSETREVAKFSSGCPLAIHLLVSLAKYHPEWTMTQVLEHAAEHRSDMNYPSWTETDQLVYILTEMASDMLSDQQKIAFGAMCIFHAAFSTGALVHLLHFSSPTLLERHIMGELKKRSLVSHNTLLNRYVMQPIALKHGFASLEDREHRVFRRLYTAYYFNELNYIATVEPLTQDDVEAIQDNFRLDYPHMLRAFRYCTDIRDSEVVRNPTAYNIFALAFPDDTVYSFLRRAAYLSTVSGSHYLVCATHLTLAYFEEQLQEWGRALQTLAVVFQGCIDFVRRPGMDPEQAMQFHELLYFCRHLERRFRMRLGESDSVEIRTSAMVAYREYHMLKAHHTPLLTLLDLQTLACTGGWKQISDLLVRHFEAVKVGMVRLNVPARDEKQEDKEKEPKEPQPEPTEATKIATSKYASDGVVVLIAYVSLCIQSTEYMPPHQDFLKMANKLRRIGLLLRLAKDQRDAANELTKYWYALFYDQRTQTDGMPFQQLYTAMLRARRYSAFPADPMIVGPSMGLPDWHLGLERNHPVRIFMETGLYTQSVKDEDDYREIMSTLDEEERKILVLMNKVG